MLARVRISSSSLTRPLRTPYAPLCAPYMPLMHPLCTPYVPLTCPLEVADWIRVPTTAN